MAGRPSSRAKGIRALIALGVVLAYPAYAAVVSTLALACNHAIAADAAPPAEKPKSDRDCHKRTEGQRSGKPCPDGGERLPQDRRSPLDSLPPLAPLVA
jgi:hypothetical protein